MKSKHCFEVDLLIFTEFGMFKKHYGC